MSVVGCWRVLVVELHRIDDSNPHHFAPPTKHINGDRGGTVVNPYRTNVENRVSS